MKNPIKNIALTITGIGLAFSTARAKAETLEGKVYDALTSQPVSGINVFVDNVLRDYANSNGEYSINITTGRKTFKVSDNVRNYFNYEEEVDLTTDTIKNIWVVPVRELPENSAYGDFIIKFRNLTDTWIDDPNSYFSRWHDEYLPLKVFYNETQANDILGTQTAQVYFDLCTQALGDITTTGTGWENRTGLNLFERVYEDPEIGIIIDYSRNYSAVNTLYHFPDGTPKKKAVLIDNDELQYGGSVRLLGEYKHELGHCLNIDHSLDSIDIMQSASSNGISQNEADIIKIMYTMQNFTDMAHYNSNKEITAVKRWGSYE